MSTLGATSATAAGWPGRAMMGGRCPAEQMRIWPRDGLITAHSTVASASGSKYRIFRSSRSSTSAGSVVCSAYDCSELRIRPMITAAGRPVPATSPMTAHTSPEGSGNTSYQSPPTFPVPGT